MLAYFRYQAAWLRWFKQRPAFGCKDYATLWQRWNANEPQREDYK